MILLRIEVIKDRLPKLFLFTQHGIAFPIIVVKKVMSCVLHDLYSISTLKLISIKLSQPIVLKVWDQVSLVLA